MSARTTMRWCTFASAPRWSPTVCPRGSPAAARARRSRPRSTCRSASSSTDSSRRTSPRPCSASGLAATARPGAADRSSRNGLGLRAEYSQQPAEQLLTLCPGRGATAGQLTCDGVELVEGTGGVEVIVETLEESLLMAVCRLMAEGAASLHGGEIAPVPRRRRVDLAVVVRPGLPVVVGHEEEPHRGTRHTPDEVADEDEVAERLAHLHPLVVDHRDVRPVTDVRRHPGGLGLGDLRFVVRKDQVVAAPVNVDGMTERAGGHHGALDVPAGPALPPRARPARLAGGG